MLYFALVATLRRTTSKYGDNVYQYEECWFAAVSCMCIRDFQLLQRWMVDRQRSISERVEKTL